MTSGAYYLDFYNWLVVSKDDIKFILCIKVKHLYLIYNQEDLSVFVFIKNK